MTKKNSWVVLGFFLGLGVWGNSAEAKIAIQPDFKGTIVITDPKGEISLLEVGDKIPEIASKSTVEVFDGDFTIAAEAGDSVQISCLDHEAALAEGSSASLACGEDSGLLKSLKGTISVTDPDGKTTPVEEGKEYPIKAGGKKAPATAAAAPEAGPAAGGDLGDAPPVDSRSVESSPAR